MALSKIDVSKMITGVTPLANGGTGGTSIPATNLASGVTGTLPVASGGTGLTSGTTDQFLKFTGSTTLASAASGGITEADTWRITTTFQGNTVPITANWERDDTYLPANPGTGMTQSSGVFSFPSTGIWQIDFLLQFSSAGADNDYILGKIELTQNNSAYNIIAQQYASIKNNAAYQGMSTTGIKRITDVANQKIYFGTSSQDNNHYVQCNSNANYSYAVFTKLGEL